MSSEREKAEARGRMVQKIILVPCVVASLAGVLMLAGVFGPIAGAQTRLVGLVLLLIGVVDAFLAVLIGMRLREGMQR